MKIILNDPKSGTLLELDANKVDIATGTGWSIKFPTGKKVLLRFCDDAWIAADDDIGATQQYWQMVGEEISRSLMADMILCITNRNFTADRIRTKRKRVVKYLLI